MKGWRWALPLFAILSSLLIWASLPSTHGRERGAGRLTSESVSAARSVAVHAESPPSAQTAGADTTLTAARREDSQPRPPDGGLLPSPEHLVALGAVISDTPPSELPPVQQRLEQARGAILAFSDRIEELEQRLSDAQQAGADTHEIERKLVAAQRELELARFAERANEAELDGHPL